MRDPHVALVTRVKMALRALPLLHTKLTAVPSGSSGLGHNGTAVPKKSNSGSRNSAPATNVAATTEAGAKHPDLMPLDFLLSVMRHPKTPATLRIKMALATQPYIHPRNRTGPRRPWLLPAIATVLK